MSKDKKERLMVIDGNALIHRSFHALPPTMATKKGEVMNAVYGFTAVLLKAIREFKPDFVALTLDKKGPTFRHEEYKEYKATRVKAPDELYSQIPRVKEVANVFSIPIFELEGFEADDLIGTITKKTDSGVEKIILTGDLDTLQLVDSDTKVYTMSHGLSDSVTYDEKAVKARFNLKPEQMIDYKALRGDPADNIPGVRGIGEKTAVELLKQFKSLDDIYKEVKSQKSKVKSQIKPRIIDLLKQYEDDAYLSKKLATIKRDVPFKFNLADARFGDFNKEKVVKLFSELEFKSLLPRVHNLEIKQESKKTIKQDSELDKFERNKKLFKYILIDDDKKFKAFLEKLKKQKEFTFDTEISSYDPITADLLGISFSWKEGEAYYINFQFPISSFQFKNVNLFEYKKESQERGHGGINKKWLGELKPIFENERIKKAGHNIKFDIRVMKNNGVGVKGVEFDTMIASYILNPGTRQHNLDSLTFSEFGFEKITKEELLGKGHDKISFAELESEKIAIYSCEDADFTNRLVKKLSGQLKKEGLEKIFYTIEMPLAPVLAQMEENGVKIDIKFLNKLEKGIALKIKNLERKIKKIAGMDFNISSTQQLREVLFTKLAIPVAGVSRAKTGLSTSSEELEKLKDKHPIIRLIQEYRELTKLLNTYIEALPELVNSKTGRLHTSFNQTVAATGRLSSSEPNLQNIPIRAELGKKIRKAFVAEDGCKFLALDYSQIELRLAAHMADDPKMLKAFKEGKDIHAITAAEVNGVPIDKVTPAMRRQAKVINFGIIYGLGPHGLAQTADITYAEALDFIDNYFNSFKNIKNFIDKTIEKARKNGYVETLFGRRRYLPEINSSVMQVRKAAERMAINTPLQGTAADIIKLAMIRVSQIINELKANESESNNIRMILQVHDELVFEVREDMLKIAVMETKKIMENVIKLKVPIEVEAEVGDNWGEMEEVRIRN